MNFSHCIRVAEAYSSKNQAKVVQKLDSAIHRINPYPADTYYGKQLLYPLDSAIQRLSNRGQAPVVEKVDNTINTIHCMDKSLSKR